MKPALFSLPQTSVLAITLAGAGLLPLAATAQDISPDRCAANQAPGEVIFLTSFGYAASHGILDVLAAQKLGLFEALCIDLTMQPGGANIQLISANTAQLGGVGGASDTMLGIDNGADIIGIATYGNVGAIELLTMADSGIESLADFAGKTVGYKGAIPPQFSAMFQDNGVNPEDINWVSVGYDPIILPNSQVQGLAAYKSNEPYDLARQGFAVTEWNPDAFGIHSTFNTQIANATFAAANPTVIEDFLRASFKAYEWMREDQAHLDQALAWAAELSTAGYDIDMSRIRFNAEAAIIAESQPDGWGFGQQSVAQWQPEADMLQRFGIVRAAPDISRAMTTAYIDAIYDDAGALIWPAP
ncbi:ABC transporter substrate-binding protein [Ketogulonicigenium vulgare]|uniref:ABC-type nitrate/sulfonate/bicarbonate transport system, periplasmic component n=1 Tax=Ketogulonicigenium vulgare (strain WSH-001) TaxID=759362 RepID=F9Y6V7_KETVW|nr:ABC transporter substrate-binding protein [Ketogulonicigenium vulgare]AEM40974.1 ABC-type nitrate/sulfonate/bicarbonate transport system, periplasmic component [Ketogulonicigenium vulgare WSH-001]